MNIVKGTLIVLATLFVVVFCWPFLLVAFVSAGPLIGLFLGIVAIMALIVGIAAIKDAKGAPAKRKKHSSRR